MKKIWGMALAAVCLAMFGCPDKNVDTSIPPDNAPYVIEEVLKEFGMEVTASLDDVNGDGSLDYYVQYTGPGQLTDELFGRLLAGVTVALREVTRRSSFYADMAYLEVGSDVYQARMTELFDCEDNSSSPDEEAGCLLRAWRKFNQQYGGAGFGRSVSL